MSIQASRLGVEKMIDDLGNIGHITSDGIINENGKILYINFLSFLKRIFMLFEYSCL